MEEFENIESGEQEQEQQTEPVESVDEQEDLLAEKIDTVTDGVNTIDEKLDGISYNVDELLNAGNRDVVANADYTAQITQLHDDLTQVKEIQAFNGLVLVLVCCILFLSVGVEIGKTVVKWLRFGVG